VELGESEKDALDVAFRVGIEDVDRAAELVAARGIDGRETLYALLEESDQERREKVLALLDQGEVSAAKRMALCGRQSVQLECPEGLAGGCGHEHNYVPITCDHLLCSDCGKSRVGEQVEKYKGPARSWEAPTFGTFTIENVEDPADGEDRIIEAFGRLRRRTIPTEGETKREGAVKRWAWSSDGGRPADLWKSRLLDQGRDDLVRRLQSRYVEQGRNVPFDKLVRGGFWGVDVKEKEDGLFNVHLHVLMDMAYVPQAALSAVWEDVSGAPVVDVRRIYDRDSQSLESAVAETVAYATKPPEFESVEAEAEFATEMKGRRLVQPFGSLYGNTPDLGGTLLCANCDQQPAWWTYLGLVDEHRDNMGSVHDGESTGDDPP
jgi:hypothetical protein